MDFRRLGRTALRVSSLCLGTMNFGPYTAEEDAARIMERALDLGINFFDTANVYGRRRGEGVTEQIVGRWLGRSGRRNDVVLATKVYGRMGDGPNEQGLSAAHIRRACEESLRRLQTDHIDLYQMHHIDRSAPWDEIWQAMETLVGQGKVVYVGSSNFPGWEIARANETAARRAGLGLVSEQSLYNLTERTIELEVIPACRAYGVGLLSWSPLAGGLLTGDGGGSDGGRRGSARVVERRERERDRLDAYRNLCRDVGASPANVALAWILRSPVVSAAIVGPRTLEQLEECAGALDVEIDRDTLDRLDRIFPGPGGEAPEAYAW